MRIGAAASRRHATFWAQEVFRAADKLLAEGSSAAAHMLRLFGPGGSHARAQLRDLIQGIIGETLPPLGQDRFPAAGEEKQLKLPLDAFVLTRPTIGGVVDVPDPQLWRNWLLDIIGDTYDSQRELQDWKMVKDCQPGDLVESGTVEISKGFSRTTILLFTILTGSEAITRAEAGNIPEGVIVGDLGKESFVEFLAGFNLSMLSALGPPGKYMNLYMI